MSGKAVPQPGISQVTLTFELICCQRATIFNDKFEFPIIFCVMNYLWLWTHPLRHLFSSTSEASPLLQEKCLGFSADIFSCFRYLRFPVNGLWPANPLEGKEISYEAVWQQFDNFIAHSMRSIKLLRACFWWLTLQGSVQLTTARPSRL